MPGMETQDYNLSWDKLLLQREMTVKESQTWRNKVMEAARSQILEKACR